MEAYRCFDSEHGVRSPVGARVLVWDRKSRSVGGPLPNREELEWLKLVADSRR
jgi:hypothetical protein